MGKAFWENLNMALVAIKSQLLRTLLTALIIAIGITALVGILTAIDALKLSINQQFSTLGSNSFSIRNRVETHKRRRGKRPAPAKSITYNEAVQFKKNFDFPAIVSVSVRPIGNAVVSYKKEKTDPNVSVFGSDENYLVTNGLSLSSGRNFNRQEISSGAHIAIIGSDIAKTFFEDIDPVGQVIDVQNIKFRIIGVLEEKGSSMGFSGDRNVIIPVQSARQYFAWPGISYTIAVTVTDPEKLDAAINEATGLFRSIRRDPAGRNASFTILRSDSISRELIDNLKMVTVIATVIGIITLFGAAIGLMNIMLVSVTERTREIGIRKAIGAKQRTIKNQFLTEAVVICQIGGIGGILMGMAIGNLVAFFINVDFIVPWMWILLAFALTFVVGVTAGYYPASKASRLDPIEALRYE